MSNKIFIYTYDITMKPTDKYILRLTNTVVGNQAARLTANKDGVFITIPNYLKWYRKSRCCKRHSYYLYSK
jgi:hypothetical protein